MKFVISDQRSRQAAIDYLQRLPDDNKRRDVAITLHREKRTNPANRLYFAWVGLIASETGSSRDEVHEALKVKFLGKEEREVLGELVVSVRSSAKLDTKQFSDYMTQVEVFASTELGIVCPHPEDAFYEDFMREFGVI